MWLHLDHTYFLAAHVKVVLGGVFLYGALWHDSYPAQLTAAGVVSLVAAGFVWRDSQRTVQLYLKDRPQVSHDPPGPEAARPAGVDS